MKTLFHNGTIRTNTPAAADWVVVEDGRISALGSGSDMPVGDATIDLDGGALVPGFCDAHVHLPATGLYAGGMDFRGVHSADRILDSFAAHAARGGAVMFGGNFEDPLDRPLTRTDLDRVVGDRPAMLARADMHSCIVSSALIEQLDLTEIDGVDVDDSGRPTGYLREQAACGAWNWFDASLPRGRADRSDSSRDPTRLLEGRHLGARDVRRRVARLAELRRLHGRDRWSCAQRRHLPGDGRGRQGQVDGTHAHRRRLLPRWIVRLAHRVDQRAVRLTAAGGLTTQRDQVPRRRGTVRVLPGRPEGRSPGWRSRDRRRGHRTGDHDLGARGRRGWRGASHAARPPHRAFRMRERRPHPACEALSGCEPASSRRSTPSGAETTVCTRTASGGSAHGR